jgi:hypothetical protein
MPCPLCGSDRLISLTFPQDGETAVWRTEEAPPERPVLKCAVCGNRVYREEVERSDDELEADQQRHSA